MSIKKETDPETGEVRFVDTLTKEVYTKGPDGGFVLVSGGSPKGAGPSDTPFQRITETDRALNTTNQQVRQSLPPGLLPPMPNFNSIGDSTALMASGGNPSVALGGVMLNRGLRNQEEMAPFTEGAQGSSEVLGSRLASRFLPPALRIPATIAASLAGGEAGNVADQQAGNPTEGPLTRALGGILGGLGEGLGGHRLGERTLDTASDLTNQFGRQASRTLRDGSVRVAPAFASNASTALQAQAGSRAVRSLLLGTGESVGDLSETMTKQLDETFLPPISESTIDTYLRRVAELPVGDNNFSVAQPIIDRAKRGIAASGNAEKMLRAFFGSSPAEAVNAARAVRLALADDPRAQQEMLDAFVTRTIVGESLVRAKGLGGRGMRRVSDEATGAVLPQGIEENITALSAEDFVLDGAKFAERVRDLDTGLDAVFGKGSKQALLDLADIMEMLDPVSAAGKGVRDKIASGASNQIKYSARNMAFRVLQSLGTGVTAGGGTGALTGLALFGGLTGVVAGTTAIAGTAYGVDMIARAAVKNPRMVELLKRGIKEGESQAVSTAMRSLIFEMDVQYSDIRPASVPPPAP